MVTLVTRVPEPFVGDLSNRPRYAKALPVAGFAHRYESRLTSHLLGERVPQIPDLIGNAPLTARTGRGAQVATYGSSKTFAFLSDPDRSNYSSYNGQTNPLSGTMRTLIMLINPTLRDVAGSVAWGNTGFPYELDVIRQSTNAWRAASVPSWTRNAGADAASSWDCLAVCFSGGTAANFYVNGTQISGTGSSSEGFTHLGLGSRGDFGTRFHLAAVACHPDTLTQAQVQAVEQQWRADYGF